MAKETKESVASLVHERFSRWARVNMGTLTEMEHACLMYSNEQWNTPGSKVYGGRWIPLPRPRNRVRLTVNKLPALVETMIDTYMRERPIITATPHTSTEIDKRSAKISELLLKHAWDVLYFDEKLLEALLWVGVAGCSFAVVGWDKHSGRSVVKGKDVMPQGQPSIDIVDPFSMAIETGAVRFEDAGWYIHGDVVDKNAVEREFNTKIETVSDDFMFQGFQPNVMHKGNIEDEQRTRLYTMFERPTSKHKDGRKVYVCNNRRIHEEPLPLDGYGNPQVEIVQFSGVKLPGQMYGTSITTMATPSQIELNKTKSQLLEYRNYATRPMMIAPLTAFTGSPEIKTGGILKWDDHLAQHEPRFMSPPMLSGDIYQLIGITEGDIADVASQHSGGRGAGTSGSINSAKQAQHAAGADEARLTPAILAFQIQLAKLGKYVLQTYERSLSGDEIIYIVGKDRQSDVYEFQANEVSSLCNITYDIISKLPWTKESTRQQAMWMRMQGLIDDETFKNYMDISTPGEVYEFERTHRENARQENRLLEQEYFPPIPTDNDAIHIEEHKSKINSPEIRMMLIEEMISQKRKQAALQSLGQEPQEEEEQYPLSIKNILQHIEEHQQRIPKGAAPAPAAKVNLSIDRLLQHPAIANNPKTMQQFIQIAQDLALDAASFDSGADDAAQQQTAQPRAPKSGPSPGGGFSGEMYSAALGDKPKG